MTMESHIHLLPLREFFFFSLSVSLSIGALHPCVLFEVGFDVSFIYYGSGDIFLMTAPPRYTSYSKRGMEIDARVLFPVIIAALFLPHFFPGEGAAVRQGRRRKKRVHRTTWNQTASQNSLL